MNGLSHKLSLLLAVLASTDREPKPESLRRMLGDAAKRFLRREPKQRAAHVHGQQQGGEGGGAGGTAWAGSSERGAGSGTALPPYRRGREL